MRSKELKREVKKEKSDEHFLKGVYPDLKKLLNVEKLEKNDLKKIKTLINKSSKSIYDELTIVSKEIKNIQEIEKLSVTAYFEVLDEFAYVFETIKKLNDMAYPEDNLKKLEQKYIKLNEKIKEDEQFEFQIEKWLLSKAKKIEDINTNIKKAA